MLMLMNMTISQVFMRIQTDECLHQMGEFRDLFAIDKLNVEQFGASIGGSIFAGDFLAFAIAEELYTVHFNTDAMGNIRCGSFAAQIDVFDTGSHLQSKTKI